MSRVVFRSDGNTSIGMGHVVRCLALANMLKPHFEVTFAIHHPHENVLKIVKDIIPDIISLDGNKDDISLFIQHLQTNDIVVLDGYEFKSSHQQKIKSAGYKLVYIDDLIEEHQYADVVINQALHINPSRYKTEINTQLYLGLRYALLRSEFLDKKVTITNKNLNKVIISMGAADINNLSLKFAKALTKVKAIKEINIILGAVNPHTNEIEEFITSNKDFSIKMHFNLNAKEMYELLSQNDLLFCPASGVIIEACAIGIPIVSGFSAENQIDNLSGFNAEGILINLGDLRTINEIEIIKVINGLSEEPLLVEQQIKRQKVLIDKKSPKRILNIFKNLENDKLHFRFAEANDALQYFEWTNDETVRQQSFNQSKVDLQDHIKWFNKKLSSENCYFYLFLENSTKKAVGQIRIEVNDAEHVIGISIDKDFRGRGFGDEMVRKATQHYLQKHTETKITAYIKLENIASYRTFLKADFILEKEIEIDGFKSYKLYKN